LSSETTSNQVSGTNSGRNPNNIYICTETSPPPAYFGTNLEEIQLDLEEV
jgi:hypothetical protein